jgi:hypothetical protein
MTKFFSSVVFFTSGTGLFVNEWFLFFATGHRQFDASALVIVMHQPAACRHVVYAAGVFQKYW